MALTCSHWLDVPSPFLFFLWEQEGMDTFENLSWKMPLDFLAGSLATQAQRPRKKKVLLDRAGIGMCVHE